MPSGRGRPPLTQRTTATRSSQQAQLRRYVREEASEAEEEQEIGGEEGWRLAISSFQQTMEASLKKLQKSVSKLERELGQAVEFQAQRIDDLENKMAAKETECNHLASKIATLEGSLTSIVAENNKLERMSRRNNFRIVGIPVTRDESCEDIVKDKVFSLFKDAPELSIERCHRDGRPVGERPPHILVRCLSYKAKMFIMKHRRIALEGQEFFIVDDLTKTDLQEKKKWASKVKDLYDNGVKLRFTSGRWRNSNGKPYEF